MKHSDIQVLCSTNVIVASRMLGTATWANDLASLTNAASTCARTRVRVRVPFEKGVGDESDTRKRTTSCLVLSLSNCCHWTVIV